MTVPTAGVLELRVTQLAPTCRKAGRLLVRVHAGRNVVRFRGRVRGRKLEPGTYRITPHLRRGPTLRSIVVVVVAGAAPLTGEVAAGRAANVCGSATNADASSSGAALADVSSTSGAQAREGAAKSALPASRSKETPRGGVLGADFTQTLRDPTSVSPVLLILLAIAICLLSLAALPRTVVTSPALAEQLTNRRLELALAGTSTLLVVALTYMLF